MLPAFQAEQAAREALTHLERRRPALIDAAGGDAGRLDAAVRDELIDRYGQLPDEVRNLLEVAAFRNLARAAGLSEVVVAGKQIRFGPVELRESQELKVKRLYPGTLVKPALRTILVPRPATARIGGQPLRDLDLLAWARGLVTEILTPLARSEGKG